MSYIRHMTYMIHFISLILLGVDIHEFHTLQRTVQDMGRYIKLVMRKVGEVKDDEIKDVTVEELLMELQ